MKKNLCLLLVCLLSAAAPLPVSYTHLVSRTLEEESIISQELVDEICDENRDVPLVDMSVLDVAPQEYKIDQMQIVSINSA